jgi:N-hydroxyarylamine O-acetyltransferase
MAAPSTLDIEAYLSRTGYSGSRSPSLATLAGLQRAHLATIPFENIDVLLGQSIRLDLQSLQDKLVHRRRGGYCFEHNSLFTAVLRELGFAVATLEARVRPPGATQTLPRTHMTLRVEVEDGPFIVDVGFGGDGPVAPVPLDGSISEQEIDSFRVVDEGSVQVLQMVRDGSWRDQYAFGLDPALPVDFEVANYYTSTFPGSIFTQRLTVQRSPVGERRILRGLTLVLRSKAGETVREIGEPELSDVIRNVFGIDMPGGAPPPTRSRPTQ